MSFPNYIRTLLLNQANTKPLDFFGEEYVPASFSPRTLPSSLRKIRAMIFGANPDRHMLNYRLHQLMPVLHASELVEFVTSVDDRISYLPFDRTDLFASGLFGNSYINLVGDGEITAIGDLDPDESLGRLYHLWRVTVTSGEQATVRRLTTPLNQENYAYTVTNGLSSLVPLLGSSQYCNFNADVGDVWYVDGVARPARNTATILSLLKSSITENDEAALFGETLVEPYKTFKNLWRDHDYYAYQLGAVLLALAYRTAEAPQEES